MRFIAISLAFCGFTVAHGTTVIPLSLDDLTKRAPVIVYGRVVQIEVDSKSGWRTAVVEATEVAKGSEEFRHQRDFYIPLHDRFIPFTDIAERVSDAPDLKVLEEVVLFLRPIPQHQEGVHARRDSKRIFSLMGFHQGKLRVFRAENNVRFVAAWNERPEKKQSLRDLQKQKTTKRFGKNKIKTQEDEKINLDSLKNLQSLDAVLNKARAAAVSEEK